MNYLVYISLLNLTLISRLRLLFKDDGASRKDAIIIGLLSCLLLPFLQVNGSWFLLLGWLLVYHWIFYKSEQSYRKRNRNRLLVLLLDVLVLGVLSSPLFSLSFNSWPSGIANFFQEVLLFGSYGTFEISELQIGLFGFLLVINEMNILFRYLLGVFRLKPLTEEDAETSEKEYNTGRLIGILERIFVFIFVLLGQYTAIGFILAAKGVARFQDFKSRTFAEYVLIGTLLSTLFAMAAGYFVILLLA